MKFKSTVPLWSKAKTNMQGSAYHLKARELTSSAIPSACQYAHWGYAGIGCQLTLPELSIIKPWSLINSIFACWCVLPRCIQSMRLPTKSKCFICLKTIKNELIPLGKDLLAAKLYYLQRGGCCCKEKWKKWKGLIWWKKSPPNIFFLWKGVFWSAITWGIQ